jgi:7-cyano-7-deazaguanine reductase
VTDLGASPLGHATSYADEYDPRLLFPVERAPQREELGFAAGWPFHGVDLWNAYELSWLDPDGKPQVAIATLAVPAASPRIVESKSVKLYLTAFNQTRFASAAAVEATLARDFSAATGAGVDVALTGPEGFAALPHGEPEGFCLDALPVACDRYVPDPDALAPAGPAARPVAETLFTRLFRSVCPVTGQPDYASVGIAYEGPAIDHAGLLRYLVSFRRHAGFHEHCVERIFVDVWRRCAPAALAVHARFTRRGGVDINPFRTSGDEPPPPNRRTARQ